MESSHVDLFITVFTEYFTAATYGFLTVGLAFLAGSIGSLIKAAFAMSGALSGPLLAVFTQGMLLPHVNGRSALLGLVTGQLLCLVIVSFAVSSDDNQNLATSIAGCAARGMTFSTFSNLTDGITTQIPTGAATVAVTSTKISHLLVPISGFGVTFIVSLLSTFVFGTNDPRTVNPELLSKWVRDYYHPVETLPTSTTTTTSKEITSTDRTKTLSVANGDTSL